MPKNFKKETAAQIPILAKKPNATAIEIKRTPSLTISLKRFLFINTFQNPIEHHLQLERPAIFTQPWGAIDKPKNIITFCYQKSLIIACKGLHPLGDKVGGKHRPKKLIGATHDNFFHLTDQFPCNRTQVSTNQSKSCSPSFKSDFEIALSALRATNKYFLARAIPYNTQMSCPSSHSSR